MPRQINIQLIDRIKKTSEGNRFLNGIMSVLMFLLYPLILIFGLITMFFVGIFAYFQRLFTSPKNKLKIKSLDISDNRIEQWNILTSFNDMNIYQKWIGEIRYGPEYLNLRSEPKIDFLDKKLFGNWFYFYSNGILLQEWNSTEKPNTNLIFINTNNCKVQTIEKNIPSVNWKIVETKDKALELNCDTGREILTYKIEIKNVG